MPTSHPRRLVSAARFIDPMQCLPVEVLPEGPEWAYEFKLDGYRALGLKSAGIDRLVSRNAKDLSARFPHITAALKRLSDETIVDGEFVAIDTAGRPSFNDLQNYQTSSASLFYYLFDLLTYRGKDLRRQPLRERCAMLETKVMSRLSDPVPLSEIHRSRRGSGDGWSRVRAS